jgi:phosphate starvation-inducible protein PhoH and related proteins
MKTVSIDFDNATTARAVFGAHNEHLKLLERHLSIRITQQHTSLQLSGAAKSIEFAQRLLADATNQLESGKALNRDDFELNVRAVSRHGGHGIEHLDAKPVLTTAQGKPIQAKGPAQLDYVKAIDAHDIVFGLGPAGTGKTYLAVAAAVNALNQKRVRRIILARPAVEAGEKLGFLPGDMTEKVDPFLRPLYDALDEMLGGQRVTELQEQKIIEVAPLAFMRGRTLSDSFAILDEAQNTTVEQMKMFLTRLGHRSKAVVTGDVTQVDLPPGKVSGLAHAVGILSEVQGVAIRKLSKADVVRHPLVQEVIAAYEQAATTTK